MEIFDDPDDSYWVFETLYKSVVDFHLPFKKKVIRSKHTPFMNGKLNKDMI